MRKSHGFIPGRGAPREKGGRPVIESSISFELPIEQGKVREFALAVGETSDVCLDPAAARRAGFPDVVAPPTFTVTQAWRVTREERERRLGAGLDYGRVLHGEQEFVYERLPVAGESLTGVMRIARDVTKPGKRGGDMRFVTYESRFTDAEGAVVLTAYYTLIQTSKDPGR